MTPTSTATRTRHDRRWWLRVTLVGFAGYTVMALLQAMEAVARSMHQGLPLQWLPLLRESATNEYLCALAVPPIFWLADVFPVHRGTWRRNAPIILAGVVAITLV